ncbi:beta-ketoacyl synthase chain length factor [Gilliamella sp. ESL0250]|uniref:beta-ketoacyl synthase chain length factor n=1 Tax=Gilliamella sp. ESL0250 TaxID=2705036 RepID=UPI00157FC3D6|nr:beta-ketoacyl synthase chain length factor [Gilliamella sp. ESL0250]NUF48716.1 beta-ketoacyl synthase chain length factor [Gilliamella sp. ESL0250]
MNFSIENWFALSSGLSSKDEWALWSQQSKHDWGLPLPKLNKLPMMQARRMSISSRLAVEVGLELVNNNSVDLAIFTSRHGELERTYKILSMLSQNNEISPTDFSLSVHNTAAGLLTIIANQTFPITSLSAHNDSFQQGLIEALSLLNQKNKKVLLIDFDGIVPAPYQADVKQLVPIYAVGYILTSGNELNCQSIEKKSKGYLSNYPQSLAFLHAYLNRQKQFIVQGNAQDWQWTLNS